eukprot:snap_masked-scaffold_43-processed-gene-1.75-mRNA-1 protein AED:1.00 eAED:1.00 QI:0/-1/0/0/-1/1/1/0/478
MHSREEISERRHSRKRMSQQRHVLETQKESLLSMIKEVDSLYLQKITKKQRKLQQLFHKSLCSLYNLPSTPTLSTSCSRTASWSNISAFTLETQHSSLLISKTSEKQQDTAHATGEPTSEVFDLLSKNIGFIFAGQGFNPLDELKQILAKHPEFFKLLKLFSYSLTLEAGKLQLSRDYNVYNWIKTNKVPDEQYLLSSPISYPLTYICQIFQFLSLVSRLGSNPVDYSRQCNSGICYSQGVLTASALSVSSTTSLFSENLLFFLKLSFLIGHFCEPKVEEKNPMASFKGLDRVALENLISELALTGIEVGLKSAESTFVVVGESAKVSKLVEYVKQRRTELKTVCTFVKSKALFHHTSQKIAVQNILEALGSNVDIEGESLFPVFDTETGEELDCLDVRRIVELQVTRFHDFEKLVSAGTERIKKFVDFGPSDVVGKLVASQNKNVSIFFAAGKMQDKKSLDGKLQGINLLLGESIPS